MARRWYPTYESRSDSVCDSYPHTSFHGSGATPTRGSFRRNVFSLASRSSASSARDMAMLSSGVEAAAVSMANGTVKTLTCRGDTHTHDDGTAHLLHCQAPRGGAQRRGGGARTIKPDTKSTAGRPTALKTSDAVIDAIPGDAHRSTRPATACVAAQTVAPTACVAASTMWPASADCGWMRTCARGTRHAHILRTHRQKCAVVGSTQSEIRIRGQACISARLSAHILAHRRPGLRCSPHCQHRQRPDGSEFESIMI